MLCPACRGEVESERFMNRRVIARPVPIKLAESIKCAAYLNRIKLIGVCHTAPMD
jgi:hypothetical protein